MENSNFKKWGIILVVVVLVAGGGWWLFNEFSKPLPGQEVPLMGRDHVTDISGVEYNSDPPTSGNHFPVWAKPGVYDRFISDGFFIHSLEHGYVIVSYDCSKKIAWLPPVAEAYAKESTPSPFPSVSPSPTPNRVPLTKMTIQATATMSWITPRNEPPEEVSLPDSFKSDACKNLVSQLTESSKVAQRVIVRPRMNKDGLIDLTAWGRIDRLNSYDKKEVESFIKAFHNQGPEQTVE
ncbi:DUF3105 domain-containing protein [Candidatus Woesebacteria bacterium]|nr:DUF3105 domain-containing protein [Candidatus Woesebacteria bacterium]